MAVLVLIFCGPVLCYTVSSECVEGKAVHPTKSSQTIRLPYVEMLACVVIVLQSQGCPFREALLHHSLQATCRDSCSSAERVNTDT